MKLDTRNKIHAAIEDEITGGTPLQVETGGEYNDFVPIDDGDYYEVQIRVRVSKEWLIRSGWLKEEDD